MADVMTPSESMTDGQLDKATDIFRAALRKHRETLNSSAVQIVLGTDFGDELLALFRKRVEAVSNLIVRRSKLNLTLTARGALEATGRNLYVSNDVVATMPRSTDEEGETVFFKPDLSDRNGYISCSDLEKEYELRGLVPEHPDRLAKINQDDPAFADEHPNATQWRDADRRYCYAAFRRWGGDRDVGVYRNDRGWGGSWWFAGRRK